MTVTIGRRELLAALGGAAAAWPIAVRAQQRERARRIGIVMPFAKDDSEGEARIRAFEQELAKLGWTDGGNIQFDERWPADNMELGRSHIPSSARCWRCSRRSGSASALETCVRRDALKSLGYFRRFFYPRLLPHLRHLEMGPQSATLVLMLRPWRGFLCSRRAEKLRAGFSMVGGGRSLTIFVNRN
jgi:hypothetical protein